MYNFIEQLFEWLNYYTCDNNNYWMKVESNKKVLQVKESQNNYIYRRSTEEEHVWILTSALQHLE